MRTVNPMLFGFLLAIAATPACGNAGAGTGEESVGSSEAASLALRPGRAVGHAACSTSTAEIAIDESIEVEAAALPRARPGDRARALTFEAKAFADADETNCSAGAGADPRGGPGNRDRARGPRRRLERRGRGAEGLGREPHGHRAHVPPHADPGPARPGVRALRARPHLRQRLHERDPISSTSSTRSPSTSSRGAARRALVTLDRRGRERSRRARGDRGFSGGASGSFGSSTTSARSRTIASGREFGSTGGRCASRCRACPSPPTCCPRAILRGEREWIALGGEARVRRVLT